MSLAGFLISFTTRQSAQRFEKATQDPVGVQTQKLLGMVQKNADTEYGRRYGFSSIKTIKDYQQRVPVITYEDIKAYLPGSKQTPVKRVALFCPDG